MMTRKWQNSAARRRTHAKFRAKLCAMVGYPVDCCATTGEVLQDARRLRDEEYAAGAKAERDWDHELEEREQAHYRQLDGEAREREERYAEAC